jgi:hypothetical protein
LFWFFRVFLIDLLGQAMADKLIWFLIEKFGTYYLTKSWCSVFPLRDIIESPDFDKAVKKASDEYLAKNPMTIGIPGMKKYIESQGVS